MDTNGDYYETIYKHFVDYLAVDFFLNRNEEPPQEPNLLEYIHNNSREHEFIECLILTIHRLIYIETFADEMKTAIIMHLQNNKKGGTD